jgi:hypothetical protein
MNDAQIDRLACTRHPAIKIGPTILMWAPGSRGLESEILLHDLPIRLSAACAWRDNPRNDRGLASPTCRHADRPTCQGDGRDEP